MSEHRLIYADELYDTLANKLTWLMMKYGDKVYLEVGKDIREAINDQPTAYDIDKVVEQLEEKRQKCDTDNYADEPSYDEGQYDAFTEAVEIVKGGKL